MYPNLKLQLWRTGVRQNRLARLLGVDETVLSRIVNGFREPSAEVRAGIARLLRADEAWLFEREPEATMKEPGGGRSGTRGVSPEARLSDRAPESDCDGT